MVHLWTPPIMIIDMSIDIYGKHLFETCTIKIEIRVKKLVSEGVGVGFRNCAWAPNSQKY